MPQCEMALLSFLFIYPLPLVSFLISVSFVFRLTSSAIVAAKFVMAPVAKFVGTYADKWGRRPLLLFGFLALPIRGFLFSMSNNKFFLLGTQLLDGLGAGMLDTLLPLVVSDVVGNSGDASLFGTSLGAIATIQGIGATLSNVLAGMVVEKAGFDIAFRVLTSFSIVALLSWLLKYQRRRKTQLLSKEYLK